VRQHNRDPVRGPVIGHPDQSITNWVLRSTRIGTLRVSREMILSGALPAGAWGAADPAGSGPAGEPGPGGGQGDIVEEMLNISERPVQAQDRAVRGF